MEGTEDKDSQETFNISRLSAQKSRPKSPHFPQCLTMMIILYILEVLKIINSACFCNKENIKPLQCLPLDFTKRAQYS